MTDATKTEAVVNLIVRVAFVVTDHLQLQVSP